MATKDEIRAELDKLGAEQPPQDANHETLSKALSAAKAEAESSGSSGSTSTASSGGEGAKGEGIDPSGADAAVDGHNAASEIVPAEDDDKPGPGSVMSKEIRPDERGEAARGESAFAAPAGA